MHLRCRARGAGSSAGSRSRSSAPRRAGCARGTRLEARPAALLDRRDEPLVEIAARLVDPRAAVDEREQDAPAAVAEPRRARAARAPSPASSSDAQSDDRQDREVGGVKAFWVSASRSLFVSRMHDARQVEPLEDPAQRVADRARARLQQRDVGRRRHELDAVLARAGIARSKLRSAQRVLQVAVAGRRRGRSANMRSMIDWSSRPSSEDRQILVERAQVDREVGRDRRLAHAALVGETAMTGAAGGRPRMRSPTCTHRLAIGVPCRRWVIVPARYRASRFPGKPLAPIAGVPDAPARGRGRARREAPARRDRRHRRRSASPTPAAAFGARVAMTRADHPTGTDRHRRGRGGPRRRGRGQHPGRRAADRGLRDRRRGGGARRDAEAPMATRRAPRRARRRSPTRTA